MSDGAHRIRRLRWRIKVGSEEEAAALRARLVRRASAIVLPELERLLDGIGPDDEVVHVGRLEATVRVDASDAIEEATIDAIRTALRARLAELVAERQVRGSSETQVRRSTVRLSRLEALLHYLGTGALPWYAEPETADLAHVRDLEETAVSEMSGVLRRLPAAPAEMAVFLFRLLSLLPDSGWVSVVHTVSRQRNHPDDSSLIEAVERIAVAPERSSARHARLELAAAIIAGWFAPPEPVPPRAIKTAVSSEALRLFDRLALPTRLARPIETPRPVSDLWREAAASDRPPLGDAAGPGRGDRLTDPPAGQDPMVRRVADRQAFGLPVFYAGLVLVLPFLPRLFAARNIAHPGIRTHGS